MTIQKMTPSEWHADLNNTAKNFEVARMMLYDLIIYGERHFVWDGGCLITQKEAAQKYEYPLAPFHIDDIWREDHKELFEDVRFYINNLSIDSVKSYVSIMRQFPPHVRPDRDSHHMLPVGRYQDVSYKALTLDEKLDLLSEYFAAWSSEGGCYPDGAVATQAELRRRAKNKAGDVEKEPETRGPKRRSITIQGNLSSYETQALTNFLESELGFAVRPEDHEQIAALTADAQNDTVHMHLSMYVPDREPVLLTS